VGRDEGGFRPSFAGHPPGRRPQAGHEQEGGEEQGGGYEVGDNVFAGDVDGPAGDERPQDAGRAPGGEDDAVVGAEVFEAEELGGDEGDEGGAGALA